MNSLIYASVISRVYGGSYLDLYSIFIHPWSRCSILVEVTRDHFPNGCTFSCGFYPSNLDGALLRVTFLPSFSPNLEFAFCRGIDVIYIAPSFLSWLSEQGMQYVDEIFCFSPHVVTDVCALQLGFSVSVMPLTRIHTLCFIPTLAVIFAGTYYVVSHLNFGFSLPQFHPTGVYFFLISRALHLWSLRGQPHSHFGHDFWLGALFRSLFMDGGIHISLLPLCIFAQQRHVALLCDIVNFVPRVSFHLFCRFMVHRLPRRILRSFLTYPCAWCSWSLPTYHLSLFPSFVSDPFAPSPFNLVCTFHRGLVMRCDGSFSPFFWHQRLTQCFTPLFFVMSRKLNLAGRMGVRGELNFTSLNSSPVKALAEDSDEDMPLSSLTLTSVQEKVARLFDEDSLCLSTVNGMLTASDTESEVVEIPSDSEIEQDQRPVFDQPPASAFSEVRQVPPLWATPGVTRADLPPGSWGSTRHPTPPWPPVRPGFCPTPSPPKAAPPPETRNPAPPAENTSVPHRSARAPEDSRPPGQSRGSFHDRPRARPSSRMMVHVNFAQGRRSMNQIMDRSDCIRTLLRYCRLEWKIDTDADVELLYQNERCSGSARMHEYLPLGRDSPPFSFEFRLRTYSAPYPTRPETRSVPPAAPAQATFLGPRRSFSRPRVPAQSSKPRYGPASFTSSPIDIPLPSRDATPATVTSTNDFPPQETVAPPTSKAPARKTARISPEPDITTLPFFGKAFPAAPAAIPPKPTRVPSPEPEVTDISMKDSDSDIDMLEMEVDDLTVQRTAEEKEAFRLEQRELKQQELDSLEDAWTLLESRPTAHTRLLHRDDFQPQVWAHLNKGKHFLYLARRIGCSAAAKATRQRYRLRGRRYSHGESEAFNAIYAFNARVLALGDPEL